MNSGDLILARARDQGNEEKQSSSSEDESLLKDMVMSMELRCGK
jgi:hypothetical protein